MVAVNFQEVVLRINDVKCADLMTGGGVLSFLLFS